MLRRIQRTPTLTLLGQHAIDTAQKVGLRMAALVCLVAAVFVTFGLGAGLGATGLALLVFEWSIEPEADTTEPAPRPGR